VTPSSYQLQPLPLPETVPAGTEVWLLKLNMSMPLSKRDLALLSKGERLNVVRLSRHEDRVRSVATRAALRQILASRTGIPAEKLRFIMNDYGKPGLFGHFGLEFNISHSGDFALIALSLSGQVGVDIEYRGREIDIEEMSEYVYSPLERQSGLETAGVFFDHWVAKESVLKALGLGISEHLQTVSILPSGFAGYEIVHERPEWAEIRAWPISVPGNYAAALAWTCPRDRGVSKFSCGPTQELISR
jgi:4'-phosphopantetheinyl transferase